MNSTRKIRIVCSECGSENIDFGASVHWNFDHQRWDVVDTDHENLEPGFCRECTGQHKGESELIPDNQQSLFL